jgi:MOSC domain-containing protein YiiM
MIDTLRVLGVLVGRPAPLGEGRHVVDSSIAKSVVTTATLALDTVNLAGDDQADRSVHGGPDKSVYCYPAEHAAAWAADGFDLSPGSVGENAMVQGGTETEVRIGDVWRWGGALVQISQPRAPCFKFALHTGRKDAGPRMITTGRSGWYLRTLEPGVVDTAGEMTLTDRDDTAATVWDCFAVLFPGYRAEGNDAAIVRRVLATTALAPEWRSYVVARNPLASDDARQS